MRAAADAVRAALVCAAPALLIAGDGAVAAKFVLVLPATFAARLLGVHPGLDLAFALALAGEAVGSALAAHELIGWDDRASHLVLPLLCGLVVYAALRRAPAPRGPVGVGALTGFAVVVVAALWELVEWGADAALGTNFSMGREDTVGDLSADAVAAVGAGTAALLWEAGTAPAAGRSRGTA